MKRAWALIAIVAVLLLAGCENIDVYALIEPPQTTTVPTVSRSANYAEPGPGEYRLGNLVLDLYPAQGGTVRLNDTDLASRAMEALNDPARRTGLTRKEPFGGVVVIRNTDDEELGRFSVSGEGDLLGRDEEGNLFRLPAWIYYQMEYTLWQQQTGFHTASLQWDPEGDDAVLKLELPSLIMPLIVQANGYADAYCLTTKIYGVRPGTEQTKVYLLAGYAGYTLEGEGFRLTFRRITPVTLTFDKVKKNVWRLSSYQEPQDITSMASVRSILPYEYTVQAMEDMKDPAAMETELTRQATDWLRENGLAALPILQ